MGGKDDGNKSQQGKKGFGLSLGQRRMQAVPGGSEGTFTASQSAAAPICISVTFMTAS